MSAFADPHICKIQINELWWLTGRKKTLGYSTGQTVIRAILRADRS
jgi:hypothetical protein